MIDTSTRDTSAQLLRIVGLLALHLDPVKDIAAVAAQSVAKELQEVVEKIHGRVDPKVGDLLTSALSALSNASEPIPYIDCTRALLSLTSALPLLAVPASLPAPSLISRLPAELVALIVFFCQDDDLRLRQNTNLSLASTCRAFHAAAQPILRTEVHLFTAGQLERVAERVKRVDTKKREIQHLTADLNLVDLHRQADGRWPGRHLPWLVETLGGETNQLRTLKVHLRPTPVEPPFDTDAGITEAEQALGIEEDDFGNLFSGSESHPHLEELHNPSLASIASSFAVARPLYDLPPRIRSLRIGHAAYPSIVEPYTLRLIAHQSVADMREEGVGQHLHTLAIPWVYIKPQDFLPLVVATPRCPSPPISDLEITFFIEDPADDLETVGDIFGALDPTLRRLSLRVAAPAEPTWTPNDAVYFTVFRTALERLTGLEHLELGGSCIDCILSPAAALPTLRHFTFLPMPFDPDMTAPESLVDLLPSHIRSVTLCIPESGARRSQGWNERSIRIIVEACEERGIRIDLDVRQAEYNQLSG
ncbi:hypothetical protein JCM6882_005649 [Rhodosporidiobolus microsporus]